MGYKRSTDTMSNPQVFYSFITGRNEVVAKVMFLQVSVCPQGGRVSASVHAGMSCPPGDQADPPQIRQAPPPDQADPPGPDRPPPGPGRPSPGPDRHPPWIRQPPPGNRLQHTVYFLLECILVLSKKSATGMLL